MTEEKLSKSLLSEKMNLKDITVNK